MRRPESGPLRVRDTQPGELGEAPVVSTGTSLDPNSPPRTSEGPGTGHTDSTTESRATGRTARSGNDGGTEEDPWDHHRRHTDGPCSVERRRGTERAGAASAEKDCDTTKNQGAGEIVSTAVHFRIRSGIEVAPPQTSGYHPPLPVWFRTPRRGRTSHPPRLPSPVVRWDNRTPGHHGSVRQRPHQRPQKYPPCASSDTIVHSGPFPGKLAGKDLTPSPSEGTPLDPRILRGGGRPRPGPTGGDVCPAQIPVDE